MSEGPIKRWRDSFKPPQAVPQSKAIHMVGTVGNLYCGRRNGTATMVFNDVTCADCKAAIVADRLPS